MLINIFGGLGSGKTLLAVIMLQKAYERGKNIYANIWVENAQPISLKEFMTFAFPPNTVILLDEVYILAESRLSMSDTNLILSHIIFQSRKKGLDIITTAQLRRAVDVRLRSLSDIDILAIRKGKDFQYVIFYNDDIIPPKHFILPYKKAQQYFSKYNTFEIVRDEVFKSKVDKLLKKLDKR